MATPKIKLYKLPVPYNSGRDDDIKSIVNDELLPVINKPSLLEDAYILTGVEKNTETIKKISQTQQSGNLTFSPDFTALTGYGTKIQYLDVAGLNLFLTNTTYKPLVYSVVDTVETLIPEANYTITYGTISGSVYPMITFDPLIYTNSTYPLLVKIYYYILYGDNQATDYKFCLSRDKIYGVENIFDSVSHIGTNEIFFEEIYSSSTGTLATKLNNLPGVWSGSTTYVKDAVVIDGTTIYKSIASDNFNHAVGLTQYWEVVSDLCYFLNKTTGDINFYNIPGGAFHPYAIFYATSYNTTLFVSNHQNWVIGHLGDNPEVFYGSIDYPGDDRIQNGVTTKVGLLPSYVNEGFSINYREGSVNFTNKKIWFNTANTKTTENEDVSYQVFVRASYAYYVGIKNVNNQILEKQTEKTALGWKYKAVGEKRWAGSHGKRWVTRNNIHMPNYFVQKQTVNGSTIEKIVPEVKSYTPYDQTTLVATNAIPSYTGQNNQIVTVTPFETTYYKMSITDVLGRILIKFDDTHSYPLNVEHVVTGTESIRLYSDDNAVNSTSIVNGGVATIVLNDYNIDIKVIGVNPVTFKIYGYTYVGAN